MSEVKDIRWRQRFANYTKALDRLGEAITELAGLQSGSLRQLASEGLIQRFEFTHELSWKVMKDYLENQGFQIIGSRDAIRQALQQGLISDEAWINTIKSRNLTSHTYDEDTVKKVIDEITNSYYPLFVAFKERMDKLNEP